MSNFNDPLTSLSFALHQGPGQFAVLLGSGVSRSAGIPTGWGVTLDLVTKLPDAPQGVSEEALISWYEHGHGDSPSYSSLVGGLANSEVERRNLLGPYFEPTEDEREEGLKMPTKAHRAIAKMVGMGLLRVIITTNFDRLMERALADEGITADVVNHESGIAGAMPYAHSKCLVIKVHGDYLDTRLRNTEEELSAYPPELRSYLLHILDEHGLLICGWSADYDRALVEVIKSSPNRRFGMYWMHTAPLSATGHGVVEARRGTLVEIVSADAAFEILHQRVEALKELSQPRPIDLAMVASMAKRYLPRPEHRIQLEDLVQDEIESVIEIFESEEFNLDPASAKSEQGYFAEFKRRLPAYETASARILTLASIIAYHGDSKQAQLVVRMLNKLSPQKRVNFINQWTKMRGYPAYLLLYVAGTAAVAGGHLTTVARILRQPVWRDEKNPSGKPLIQSLVDFRVLGEFEPSYLFAQSMDQISEIDVATHRHLREIIPLILKWIHVSPSEAIASFEQFHYMLQLAYMDFEWEGREGGWAPFTLKYGYDWDKTSMAKIEKYLLSNPKNELIEAGLFHNTGYFASDMARFEAVNTALRKFIDKLN